jgi:hypothetical protein
MANGRLYGNWQTGYGYSPDRSRDVDRFNPSTRANYSYFDPAATYYGNRQTGYGCSYATRVSSSTKTGRYLGNGQYVED